MPTPRLHVTGCRRSGTTLMFEMLVACFEHAGHAEHEESVFAHPVPIPGGLYLSKKPSDIAHLRRILESDSDLYVVYMLRDPRAVVTSIHPSRGDTYFASFERWLRYEHAAAPLKAHPRFVEVRYETLVSGPDDVQQMLMQRLPFVRQRHAFSDFHQYAQASKRAEISLRGLRPISADSIDAWRAHLPRLRFQLDRYPELARAVIAYGYETDDAWLGQLDGVEPLPQRYGERTPPPWQRWETALRYYLKSRRYLAARRGAASKKKEAPERAP